MKRIIPILLTIMMISMVCVSAGAARLPYGAFITQPVTTVDELVTLFETDSTVSSRYISHYNMSRAELIEYFRYNIEATTLQKDTVYDVYYISGGQVIKHRKTLKAGTVIFVTKSGVPVMDASCGNPLAKNLPKFEAVKPEPPVVAVEPSLSEMPFVEPLAVEPEPVQMAVLSEPPLEFLAAVPVMTSATKAVWVLPAILGVGALGGGGEPIPEPGSIMMLGAGLTGVLSIYYRKRRK